MTGPIGFLIWLLVFMLVVYCAFWIAGQMGLPEPARRILTVIIGLIALLVMLNGGGYLPVWR